MTGKTSTTAIIVNEASLNTSRYPCGFEFGADNFPHPVSGFEVKTDHNYRIIA
jgi:hypothetical protein